MQRTGWFSLGLAPGGTFRAQSQFAPLARTGPVSLLETGIEKPKMIEAGLLCRIDDFGLGIPEAGGRLHQANFHLQRCNRAT